MTAPIPRDPGIAVPSPEVRALALHARRLFRQSQGLPGTGREATLLLLARTGGVPEYQPQITALRHGTDPVEQLRRLVPAVLPTVGGEHAGLLVVCDCLLLRGDVDDEWAGLVSGAPREDAQLWRVALGVLVSGWRVGLQARGEDAPVTVVAAPWQTRGMRGELDDALRDLNKRILAGG